jgi:hypothetical protein
VTQEATMFWLLVMALWIALLLSPLVLLYLFLPAGRDCPRCSSETILLRSRLLRPVRRLTSMRWCISCGWEGVMRNAVLTSPLPTLEVVPDDADERDSDAPWRSGS